MPHLYGNSATGATPLDEHRRRSVDDRRRNQDPARRQYWHMHETFEAVERAVRLHHRLVSVHPFRNGNGRHARFMADLYLHSIGLARLSWGGSGLVADDHVRARYIDALRQADGGEIAALIEFACT
jgi:fido (protein-threonine AMPylation protein)